MTSASDEKWRPFNCFFQSGRAKDLSAPLYIWSIALCSAETWTLREEDQKCLESYEIWCWRGMEKISWTDRVKTEVLHREKGERNILQTVKRGKAKWIGHSWRRRCRLQHVIEGKRVGMIEVKRRGGRRHKQLLDDLKKM